VSVPQSGNFVQSIQMDRSSKRYILAICLALGLSLVIGLGPLIRCAYRDYRFESYIRVSVEVPSCVDPLMRVVAEPCQYLFSFEREKNPGALQFAGSELHYTYDRTTRQFRVTGAGLVTHKDSRIRIEGNHILFDDQQLPMAGGIPIRTLVKENGHLARGFCELTW